MLRNWIGYYLRGQYGEFMSVVLLMSIKFKDLNLDDPHHIKRFERMFENFTGVEKCTIGAVIRE